MQCLKICKIYIVESNMADQRLKKLNKNYNSQNVDRHCNFKIQKCVLHLNSQVLYKTVTVIYFGNCRLCTTVTDIHICYANEGEGNSHLSVYNCSLNDCNGDLPYSHVGSRNIHIITENRNRHASGPVHSLPSIPLHALFGLQQHTTMCFI